MFAPSATDIVLRMMPKIRRKVRPKLRRVGIHLLPPRWHRHPHPHVDGLAERVRKMEEEIVQFSHEWKIVAQKAWSRSKPWIIKLVGVALVSIILYRLHQADRRTLVRHPATPRQHPLGTVRARLHHVLGQPVLLPRDLLRGVLHGLGWRFPQAPAARIWATSELVRYVPGVVWQVVGRVLLTKPYGLPATTCSISQILEITVYLLANVTVAVGMLSLAGGRISEEARPVLRAAAILLPILLVFLHPSIFYPVVNWVLRRIGKPVIEKQLTGRRLLALLLLAVVGQLWLGLALWAGTHSILQIALKDAWLLSGAYCLAWTAGFCLASVAPSGIGVREFVLRSTLYMVLPMTLSQSLDQKATLALFAAVALLLRLWATIGELLFAGLAYVWDWRGLVDASPRQRSLYKAARRRLHHRCDARPAAATRPPRRAASIRLQDAWWTMIS